MNLVEFVESYVAPWHQVLPWQRRMLEAYDNGREVLEVRCCCRPEKLLGWLPVPAHIGRAKAGTVVRFSLGRVRALQAGAWPLRTLAEVDELVALARRPEEFINLPIETFHDGAYEGLAFKSEETPLEELRRIPMFVENHAARFRAGSGEGARARA